MDRSSLFPFIVVFLTFAEVCICEGSPRYFPKYEDDVTGTQIVYPYSTTGCILSKHLFYSFLHCEEKFSYHLHYCSKKCAIHGCSGRTYRKTNYYNNIYESAGINNTKYTISVSNLPFPGWIVEMVCNKTTSSGDLNHDFPSLIGLNRSLNTILYVEDCPEPRGSFVKQFFPFKNENFMIGNEKMTINSSEGVQNYIIGLDLKCVHRKNFSIIKRHLESMSKLRFFKVSCSAVKSIPWDLFQGTTPFLSIIIIVGTQIDVIPSRLFFNLTALTYVTLNNNFIKRIAGDAFLNCRNIKTLYLHDNRISDIEENVLKNFGNLEALDLSHNEIKQFKREYCEGLSGIAHLILKNNSITHIHQKCFGTQLSFLDISGNALNNITEHPIELKNLTQFNFNDNSVLQLHIKKYFNSNGLLYFHMSNSNVISLDKETLHGFPKLIVLNLSSNKITSIPEDTFVKNRELQFIHLQKNSISSLPPSLFSKNKNLSFLDLSFNKISSLPKYLFTQNSLLKTLNFSYNQIQTIPESFFSNITSLRYLNFSNNHISSLYDTFFEQTKNLYELDLSYNSILSVQNDRDFGLEISKLFLQGNKISELPKLNATHLQYLDLSHNTLLGEDSMKSQTNQSLITPSLTELYLSNTTLQGDFFIEIPSGYKIIEKVDFSLSKLSNLTYFSFYITSLRSLKSLDLSKNNLNSFIMNSTSNMNLEYLNLSCNKISHIFFVEKKLEKLKVLDISNNNLNQWKWINIFDDGLFTWGFESPFRMLPNLEELYLRNNSIHSLGLDWRINMPYLKYVDLRENKLRFLSHQDLIFKSTAFYVNEGFGPYLCTHNLTIDLRNNLIKFIELPNRMLQILPQKNETKVSFGIAKLLIDDNPLECGCAVFNLLKIIRYDAVLTSELRRVTGQLGMLSAELVIGNLSCSAPQTVRGRKLNNTEEWIHHLLPLFGLCTLQDLF